MKAELRFCLFSVLFLAVLGCNPPGSPTSQTPSTPPPTFSIIYDGNGSTGGSVPIDPNKYQQNQAVTVLGNSGNLVESGNTFAGWNTRANGSGTTYSQGQTFGMGNANLTLYARWTSLPTYTVTYNANGLASGAPPSDSTNYLPGQIVTILGNSGNLAIQGYGFTGWNTKADGTGTKYSPGSTFAMAAANVTLYAIWAPTYSVTYTANTTGTTGNVPIDSNGYLQGATVTVMGAGSLAKTGYVLTGWNTAFDGSGTPYAPNSTFVMGNSNATLYGIWVQAFTVTYDGNGNTGGNPPTDSTRYVQNATVTVLGNGGLTKNYYGFAGWNTQADGGGTQYNAGQTFVISANVTVYAQWVTLTVTYDGNGNTSGTVPIDSSQHLTGWSVTVLGNTGNLAKAGSTFIGWNTQANGNGIRYLLGQTFTMGPSPVTLYAMWTSLSTYVVTYDGNLNTGGTPPVDPNNYLPGDTVTVLSPAALVRAGFGYAGWNTRPDDTGTSYVGYGPLYYGKQTFTMGSSNATLYAVWYTAGLSLTQYTTGTYGTTSYSVSAGTATSGNIVIPAEFFGVPVVVIGSSGFYGDTGITGVTIPNTITSIGNDAFRGCTGLSTLTLPSSVTSIGAEAFLGCSGLSSLSIPGSVTSIGNAAFEICTGLTSISIPSSLPSIAGVFMGCTGLTTVIVPAGVTTIEAAFDSCTNLTSVTLPDTVTNINSAFSNCTSLTSLTLPSSVTDMAATFENCTRLTTVVINATTPPRSDNYMFLGCVNLAAIKVPPASVTAYQNAPFWSTYAGLVVSQ